MRLWTKEKVISELRRTRKERNRSPDNVNAAARLLFGSLRAALDEAGLPCGKNGRPIKKWSKDLVIQEIRKRATDRRKLRKTQYEDKPLYSSARRYFGSWGNAVKAAGFSLSVEDYFYSLDQVQLKIVELYERGDSMRLHSHKDEKLKRSVIKHFGTWSRAVKSLGLDAELKRTWTNQKVIDALRHRWANGRDLARTRFEDPGLVSAACTRFGGWVKALEAAGFQGQVHTRWTDEQLLDALRLYATNHSSKPITVHNRKLADMARTRFGSLTRAFANANVPPSRDLWNKERVVLEIMRRYQSGEHGDTEGFGDLKLAKASRRHFGGWAEAVEAAGLSNRIVAPKPPRKWDANDVIDHIRRCHRDGQTFPQMLSATRGLLNAAQRNFGGWKNAIFAAGLKPENRLWTRDAVVFEIQERVKSGKSLRSNDPSNGNLVSAGYRFFGSWPIALEAAGVNKQKKRRGTKS